MAELLIRLRNLPDDEIDEIRTLLAEHQVQTYETDAGNWGISMPAIWVHDRPSLERARALLDNYQRARQVQARERWLAERAAGQSQTMLARLRARPLAALGIVAFCLVLLYAMIVPFVRLAL